MDPRRFLPAIVLILLLLPACSPAQPPVQMTPTLAPVGISSTPLQGLQTATSSPTVPMQTPSPVTPTASPQNTTAGFPTATVVFSTPIPDWKGIPIMPGANEGEPAGLGYLYSINLALADVEKYYQDTMQSAGWSLIKRQTSEKSMLGGPAVILDYQKDEQAWNLLLISSTTNQYTIVSLTQTKP